MTASPEMAYFVDIYLFMKGELEWAAENAVQKELRQRARKRLKRAQKSKNIPKRAG